MRGNKNPGFEACGTTWNLLQGHAKAGAIHETWCGAAPCFTLGRKTKRPLCLIQCQNCIDVCNIVLFLFLEGMLTVIYEQLHFYFWFGKSQSLCQLDAPVWACPELWDTQNIFDGRLFKSWNSLTRWAGFESFERLESLGLRRALTSWRCWTGLRHCGWRKILGVIRVLKLLATESHWSSRNPSRIPNFAMPKQSLAGIPCMQLFLPDIILAQCDLQIFALLTFCCVSHPFPVYKVNCACGCFLYAACWECAFWRAGHKSLWSRLKEVRRSLFWTWILSSSCLLRIYWKCLDWRAG